MGKRELLLILGFLILGGLAYQIAAPPAEETGTGRSWSEALRNLRGEIFGSRARFGVDRRVKVGLDPATTTLDLGEVSGRVDVTGEDREDVEALVKASLLGENEAEVQAAAAALTVRLDQGDGRMVLHVQHPDEWRLGRGRGSLDVTLKVPARLALALNVRGNASVRGTGAVELDTARGNVVLKGVAGPVTGAHRDGSLEVDGAPSVDLETRRVSVRLARVAGEVNVEAADGRLIGQELGGAVELDTNRVSVELDGVKGKVSLSGGDGRAQLTNVLGELSIDTARMATTLVFAKAVAAVVEVADAPLEVTLPPAGATLEVEALEGSVQVPSGFASPTAEGTTQRLQADWKGGGPICKLSMARGTVVLRVP